MPDFDDEDDFAKLRRKKAEQQNKPMPPSEQQEQQRKDQPTTIKPLFSDPKVVGFGRKEALKAGMELVCRIVAEEPGGYAVMVVQSQTPGFLPTQALLETGQEIRAQFVCFNKGRVLVSARFSQNVSQLVEKSESNPFFDVNAPKPNEDDDDDDEPAP